MSPQAISLIVERILSGDANIDINVALRRAGHLPAGVNLSDRTFTQYRKSDAVKVSVEKLTDEARQTGHAALSEAIVINVRMLRAGAVQLLDAETGGFHGKDIKAHRTAAAIVSKASDFLWTHLGVKDVLAVIEESEKQSLNATESSGMTEALKNEMSILVKEQNLKMLKILAARKKAMSATAAREAPSGNIPS